MTPNQIKQVSLIPKIKYCCECGSPMKEAVPKGDNMTRSVCPQCGFIHYVNPKVIVGVLPYYEDRVLLCQRAIEPGYKKWTLPSGFLEIGESVQAGAQREAKEEAGIHCEPQDLYVLYNIPHIGQVYMLFLCKMTSQEIEIGPETLAAEWVPYDQIDPAILAFSSIRFTLSHFESDFKDGHFPIRYGAYTPK